jgi:hypothetical protein
MAGAVAALALLGLIHHGDGERRDAQVQHARIDGWRLEVRQDRFTGKALCTLERDHVAYDHGVVTFAFGRQVDTASATYRLDGGPVRRAGDVAVEAAGMGVRFDTQNLANPSNGEVHIPARELGEAHKIYIRANTRMTHRIFDLTGLPAALDAARSRNCDAP